MLSEAQKVELEDFALEAAQTLIDQRRGQSLIADVMGIWQEAGVDPNELLQCAFRERDEIMQERPRRLGPVQGFVIPTLKRCGLLSERVAGRFHEFLAANLSGKVVGHNVEEFLARVPDLPEDTAAWLLGQAG
jgi:hypothetical protein